MSLTQLQARNPISNEVYGVKATQAAFRRCERMGHVFSEESHYSIR